MPLHPFTYTKPVTSDTTFVGREENIDSILASFYAPSLESVGLVGGRRIGKTSLILEVKKRLDRRLKLETSSGFPTIGVYVDLSLRLPYEMRSLFQGVAMDLVNEFSSLRLIDHSITRSHLFEDRGEELAFGDFKQTILLLIAASRVSNLRIALLFDGMDVPDPQDRFGSLFSQLRHLITTSELANNVAVLVAGGEEMYSNLREAKGSPLQNALRRTLFLNALSALVLSELCDKSPRSLRQDERTEVFQASGGHPFLAQYLLAKLNEFPQIDIPAAARTFLAERDDFGNWTRRHLDPLSLRIFTILGSELRPLPLEYVVAKIGQLKDSDSALKEYISTEGSMGELRDLVSYSLRQLTFTGLVRQNEADSNEPDFEISSLMFRDWFFSNGYALTQSGIQENIAQTEPMGENQMKAKNDQASPIRSEDRLKTIHQQKKEWHSESQPTIMQPVHQESGRSLKVFLCHSSGDKPIVRELYNRLQKGKLRPWLDEKMLLPGQDWQLEIPKAVRDSDVVIVCISKRSINKEGYLQKELRIALDVADEKPEGAIFIIPLRLEECDIPERLRRWQWVDYFEPEGFSRLMLALRKREQAT